MTVSHSLNAEEIPPMNQTVDFVNAYSDSVYRFCRSLTYTKEDADDLFQETFLKAYEQHRKLKESKNPQSFLFATSLYIWKSWQRKYARRHRLAPTAPMDENMASGICTEDHIIDREEIRIVRKLVAALPEKYRIPTILYYTMEMSVAHIAITLKLPAGTVKSRLYKARKLIEKGLIEIHYEK